MDQQLPACAICGTTQQLLRCAKCKTVYYCSSSHQYIDWPSHKKECRQLARQKTNNKQLQQLQQAVAAATLNNARDSVDSAAHQQTTPFMGVGASGGSATASALTVKLGTNENEIMNSQAELMSPLHTNGVGTYLGNVEANTTTMDQMYSCKNEEQNLHPQWQHDLLNRQFGEQQSQEQQSPQHPPQQHNLLLQHDQHPYLQQQLSNQNSKQFEKSSSYQIELGDENSSGNANERRYEELCRNIINDMNQYGLSVVDDFLGMEKGLDILSEVHHMYAAGVFRDGQLVSNLIADDEKRTIRGDKITWVKGVEPGCSNVGYLINQIDAVICRANTMQNNGKLGNYNIRERTKAMVACYPGSGSHYVMHVDNPNYDGRVITAIYYLNVNWDTLRSGGVLRIFPENGGSVADIEPKFDRLIFFWSDKRNPHEVQPAHRTRYAITVWYFDAEEREAALNRCRTLKNKASNSTIKPANIPTTTNTADVFT